VRSTRANSTELSVKIINESQAGRPQSDIFDGTSTVVVLKKRLRAQMAADPARPIPPQYKDPEGYWSRTTCSFSRPASTPARPRAASHAPTRTCS